MEAINSTLKTVTSHVVKCCSVDTLQKHVLNKLSYIIEKEKITVCSSFQEYFTNYKKDNAKVKKNNKGGPLDNWFERCLSNILKRNSEVFKYTYQDYNEFVVPDIIEVCDDYVLCLDGKTNSGDGDSKKEKVHFGVNQSNIGSYTFQNYVSNKNPEESWGTFRGDIIPYYNDKPTLCYIAKIIYDDKKVIPECLAIHLYCIPHRDTMHLYKDRIKRGANKSSDEQRLEINDESLINVINFKEQTSSS